LSLMPLKSERADVDERDFRRVIVCGKEKREESRFFRF
jgi:hypothetical protein